MLCIPLVLLSTVAAQHQHSKTSQTENVNDNIEQGVPREHGNEHVRSGILRDGFSFFFIVFLPTRYTTTDVEIFTEENHSRYMERGVKVNGSVKKKKKFYDLSAGLYRGDATFSSAY